MAEPKCRAGPTPIASFLSVRRMPRRTETTKGTAVAVAMTLVWPEITPELYDKTRIRTRWEEDVPDGVVLHASWFADDGFHVFDIWESESQFSRFIAERIAPVLKGELGVQSDPQVTFSPLYRRFVAPGVTGAA